VTRTALSLLIALASASRIDPQAEAMSAALPHAIEAGWKSLHLLTRCPPSAQLDSVEVFGSGVAVWNGSRQFELPAETIHRILVRLRDAGFATMPAAHGGRSSPLQEGPRPPRPATEVTCLISLELDGAEKEVVQLRKGSQSEELRLLAAALLDLARGHAERGITPTGLDDALAKLASGVLAPELFGLSLQKRPTSGPGEGSLLVIRRQRAEARPLAPAGGWGAARSTLLDASEICSLAELLVRDRLPTMPANLWSEVYTDLDVSVMRWGKSIQARQFDGLEPDALGARQKAYDHLVGRLNELAERILQPPVPAGH
jgi:hypothetical protein